MLMSHARWKARVGMTKDFCVRDVPFGRILNVIPCFKRASFSGSFENLLQLDLFVFAVQAFGVEETGGFESFVETTDFFKTEPFAFVHVVHEDFLGVGVNNQECIAGRVRHRDDAVAFVG
jgi:hypothetical protein